AIQGDGGDLEIGACNPGVFKDIGDETLHALAGSANSFDVRAKFRRHRAAIIFEGDIAEAFDGAGRGAKVVRNAVRELLHLREREFEGSGALSDGLLQNFTSADFFRDIAGYLGDTDDFAAVVLDG